MSGELESVPVGEDGDLDAVARVLRRPKHRAMTPIITHPRGKATRALDVTGAESIGVGTVLSPLPEFPDTMTHQPNPDQNEGTVELNFEANVSLDDIAQELQQPGVGTIASTATAETFGKQPQLISPDGLRIKINEIRDDL